MCRFCAHRMWEPFRINDADIRYITPEFHAKLKKSALRPGDVVIVRTGKPGATAIIPEWLTEANCSDLVIVRPGVNLDRRFLVYFMNSRPAARRSAFIGAVQQHFNVGSARSLKLTFAAVREQQAIACILGALDDKIELNVRMNRTLEATAPGDLPELVPGLRPCPSQSHRQRPGHLKPEIAGMFPNVLEDSELGEIPKGLSVRLGKSRTTRGGESAQMQFPRAHDLALDHMPRRSIALGDWSDGDGIESNKFEFRKGEILFGKLRPYFHKVGIFPV